MVKGLEQETSRQQTKQREVGGAAQPALLLGRYEVGKTLGEGNFGKVQFATDVAANEPRAIKILDRQRILSLGAGDQIKREIEALKLLKHPNVVRLYEVAASKTKIYMVLEYVNAGELYKIIEKRGKLSEGEARQCLQQLIDAVSYCHSKGVFHRDLKPENVLVDSSKGRIKITDFGLSALPKQISQDGLLHTTCGSPNYIAPEVLANRGYDGALSDIWSCGVILYYMLVGDLPFDDRNLVILYQKISKGDTQIPNWLSPDAQDLLKRMLDPNPATRINMDGIKTHNWFKRNYKPSVPYEEDEETQAGPVTQENQDQGNQVEQGKATQINAFQLIGMSSSLDLSGFFEDEDVTARKIRFTSNLPPKEMFQKIEDVATEMGFEVHRGEKTLKVVHHYDGSMSPRPTTSPRTTGSFLVAAEVFELTPSLYVVELRKSHGDSILYGQLCKTLSEELGMTAGQGIPLVQKTQSMRSFGMPSGVDLPMCNGQLIQKTASMNLDLIRSKETEQ